MEQCVLRNVCGNSLAESLEFKDLQWAINQASKEKAIDENIINRLKHRISKKRPSDKLISIWLKPSVPLAQLSNEELEKIAKKQQMLEGLNLINLEDNFKAFEDTEPVVSDVDYEMHRAIFDTEMLGSSVYLDQIEEIEEGKVDYSDTISQPRTPKAKKRFNNISPCLSARKDNEDEIYSAVKKKAEEIEKLVLDSVLPDDSKAYILESLRIFSSNVQKENQSCKSKTSQGLSDTKSQASIVTKKERARTPLRMKLCSNTNSNFHGPSPRQQQLMQKSPMEFASGLDTSFLKTHNFSIDLIDAFK